MKRFPSLCVVIFFCVCLLSEVCLGFLFYNVISSTGLIRQDRQHFRRGIDRVVDRSFGPPKTPLEDKGMNKSLEDYLKYFKGKVLSDKNILDGQKQQYMPTRSYDMMNSAIKSDLSTFYDLHLDRQRILEKDSLHLIYKRSLKKLHNSHSKHHSQQPHNPVNENVHLKKNHKNHEDKSNNEESGRSNQNSHEHPISNQTARQEKTHHEENHKKNHNSQVDVDTTHSNRHESIVSTTETAQNHTGAHTSSLEHRSDRVLQGRRETGGACAEL